MTERSVPTQVLTILPCSYWLLTLPLIGSKAAAAALTLSRRVPVLLARGQHRPDDAGGLGGLGDHRHPHGAWREARRP